MKRRLARIVFSLLLLGAIFAVLKLTEPGLSIAYLCLLGLLVLGTCEQMRCARRPRRVLLLGAVCLTLAGLGVWHRTGRAKLVDGPAYHLTRQVRQSFKLWGTVLLAGFLGLRGRSILRTLEREKGRTIGPKASEGPLEKEKQ